MAHPPSDFDTMHVSGTPVSTTLGKAINPAGKQPFLAGLKRLAANEPLWSIK
jgi:hypothetical protein